MKMKKTILTSSAILCLLFTLLLIRYKVTVKASPDVIHVPTDYPTIQEAINHANSGDTIFVHNETYYENLLVNKSISLVGEDRETTIIDGGEKGSVIFVTANNVNIKGFTIQKSGSGLYDSGILVDHSSGNRISHNTITNNYHGIYLSHSRDNTVSGNNASLNNVNGIDLDSSSDNIITGNNASSNNVNGIRLSFSSSNIITGNNASSNNVNGIRLDSSSDNIITGNNASSNNNYGIRLDFSRSNVISGNDVFSNSVNGIRLDSSSDSNRIYHNNFNNTDQVGSESLNFWDDSDEGNYWSDYTGQDLNADGIGDTPYVIDENNQDNYPLMGKFSDFKLAWKDETHHVTTICNSTISNFRFEVGRETGNKIISFDATDEDSTLGFCRVMTPTELMDYSFIVLVDEEEITPTPLDVSNKTHVHLYFTYVHSSHITIISSKLLHIYVKLQTDFHNLNSTYHKLLGNYSQLLESYNSLNMTYQELTGNYSQLVERYDTLYASYQQHLLNYSELQGNHTSLLLEHANNIRNLTYVFIATTAIFIIAAVYLSTQTHRRVRASLDRGVR